jgi:hypothetical protein
MPKLPGSEVGCRRTPLALSMIYLDVMDDWRLDD